MPHDRRSPSGLPSALLLSLVLLVAGCGRTVNDYLREAQSGNSSDIENAIDAIGQLLANKERSGVPFDDGDRAAVVYLEELAVKSASRNHRALAINALDHLQTVDASATFLAALEDPFWLARHNAALALRNHAREEFVGPLGTLLARESRTEVRGEIVKALGVIGGEAATRILFETFLGDPLRSRESERVHAYRALRRLTGLSYGFRDRGEWEDAFGERFPPKPEAGEERPPAGPDVGGARPPGEPGAGATES